MESEAHKEKKIQKKMEKNVELPLSLIESNILPRLSAKTVGRCMCLCKQWKSFLSTPMFARMHLHHVTINDYKLLRLDYLYSLHDREPLYDGLRTIRPKLSPDLSDCCVLASLNGLVCLASWPFKLSFWNPLTGAYKRLSSLPDRPFFGFHRDDVVGLYADSSNDYKLLYLRYPGIHGAYIYSNRLDSWRKIDFFVGTITCCSETPEATLCGQCLYFKASNRRWIICFDVKTEKFRKIQCPPVPRGAISYRTSLVVLHGCIHLCVSYTIKINYLRWKHGDIWRMMDGDGWVKVASFNDPQPLHKKMFTRPRICTMCSTGNWLAVLDEEKKAFKRMNSEDFTRHYPCFSSLSLWHRSRRMIYVETLVSPVNPWLVINFLFNLSAKYVSVY